MLSSHDQGELDTSASYYQQAQPLDAGAEDGLAALRDSPPGTKPFYPYSTLIRYAIKGSPQKRLLLEDIYYSIEARFPYFRSAPTGWKNSVRHNLSLNPCFEKVPRPLTDRGKGSYWTVNDNVDPRTGVHRVRKKKNRKSQQSQNAAPAPPPQEATPTPAVPTEAEVPEAAAEYTAQAFQLHDERGAPVQSYLPAGAQGSPNRMGYHYGSFDPSVGYPVPPPNPNVRYTEEEEELVPEIDEHGQPNWRNVWLNELTKLRLATAEQDRTSADEDWYRMMVERVRGAFGVPMPEFIPVPEMGEQLAMGEQGEEAGGGPAAP